ncbi:hypothetical protein F4777DRAFT_26835 [Nemania sp. FL0916]|nr:hypothetical protein F4777DRAFT_26835 [Nemania sp. FL0916]
MYEIEKEDAKISKLAWRKKPRNFAPKSRLGCKTCKIRRIKCDLSQPSCMKCQSTGRICDGYNETPVASKTDIRASHDCNTKTNGSESSNNQYSHTTFSSYQNNQWPTRYHSLNSQPLGPLLILPVTGPIQTEALSFFEYTSVRHLNEYQPCKSWQTTLMFFSQTVPAVRYAAMALALIHRNHIDHKYSDRPLLYYNQAIQLLLKRKNSDSIETTAITLLVCYLFTCFDHLAGNDVQAMKHLRGGVELSRNIDKSILTNYNADDHTTASGTHTLIKQVTRQIQRLDMQAVMFLVDWTPVDIEDGLRSQLSPLDIAFQSLDQAADHLQVLVAQVMRLRNTEQQLSPVGNMPPLPPTLKDIVLEQLVTWSSLFENMLQQGSAHSTDPEAYRLISLLRLQHAVAWTYLSSCGPGKEMEYDKFLPQFQQCVALAGEVAAAHEQYSGSLNPTFTPEIGIVPVLYIIGAKCRHPEVRREVLSILRRQPVREAVWDSILTAKVVERIIEIEEGGFEEMQRPHSMEQIPVWQRIEALSWIHVVGGQSAARLNITYTFCGREGTHSESLVV